MKRVRRPCDECPYRVDAEPGRFERERWDALRSSSADERGMGPEFGGVLFACHRTPEGGERACAGWLAVEGINHPQVRLEIMTGGLDVCALSPGEDWPDLHPDFHAARAHDLMEVVDAPSRRSSALQGLCGTLGEPEIIDP